jgi:hypothetical protein
MITEFKSGDYTATMKRDQWEVSDPHLNVASIGIHGTTINFKAAGSYCFTIERLAHITILMAKISDQYNIIKSDKHDN